MTSGPLVGDGGGGDGSREKHRWAENKVYTRKSQKSSAKSNKNPSSAQNPPSQQQQLLSPPQPTLTTATEEVKSFPQQQPPPLPDRHNRQHPPRSDSAASDDAAAASTSPNNDNHRNHPAATDNCDISKAAPGNQTNHHNHHNHHHHHNHKGHNMLENGVDNRIVISLASRSRDELRVLRRKLNEELNQVRAFFRKLEARELHLAVSTAPTPTATGYSQSQLSANDTRPFAATKGPAVNLEAVSAGPLRGPLSVSVAATLFGNNGMSEAVEKEKRTPKANQYYRTSDFVLGKEKLPPPDYHKKSKANGSKKHHLSGVIDYGTSMPDKLYEQAFKSCTVLLSKLMKHKHGWVFNTPVDVKGLGLHDYYSIIKHPMDLGTVKSRLNKNWYKSPGEFAEDVRLTFQNAMIYNPEGQDAHVMAEQLSRTFEEHWPAIEAEYAVAFYPMPTKKAPPPLERRVLEWSESTTHSVVPDTKSKRINVMPHVGRATALKKPKAKDPHKRDMTYEEKHRLSSNLQSLPPEKLDNVVQIIKKRNSSLSQGDNEIEVDIDSVDTETLWELDRFVTNYKKSLSKFRRKAELAIQARAESGPNVHERIQVPSVVEPPKESRTDERHTASPTLADAEKKEENANRSSSSSSSSSDSGSTSSDSDSETSSAYGSDAAHSLRE